MFIRDIHIPDYSEFYPVDVEPWEPNLTVSKNSKTLKWRELLTPGIAVPTDWDKDKYESLSQKFNDKLSELSQSNSNDQEIKRLRQDYRDEIRNFFGQHKFRGKTGSFEGAGYNFVDMYRPALDCIMFSNRKLNFDSVCKATIEKRIHFFTQRIGYKAKE